jgi:integrase
MGRPHIDTHSRRRDRALAAISALGAFDLSKDPQHDERPFNHGLRHKLLDRNPVQWVRQSAKRKKIPAVLEIEEVKSLLGALDVRERTMVLLDVVTGLRASELFGLKWTDIDFIKNEISVTRSVVPGSCRSV